MLAKHANAPATAIVSRRSLTDILTSQPKRNGPLGLFDLSVKKGARVSQTLGIVAELVVEFSTVSSPRVFI